MKNNTVKLEEKENAIQIRYKRNVNDTQLQIFRRVHCVATVKSSALNTVGVSAETYDLLKGQGLVLFNPVNGKYADIVVAPTDTDADKITATNYLKESLEITSDDELIILNNKTAVFSNVKIQRIDNIREDNVVIASKDFCGNEVDLDNFTFFQIFNCYTGDSVIVKKSHVQVDGSLAKGTILLNKKQRTFLGLELPKYIENSYWKEIVSKIPSDNAEDLQLLNFAYPDTDHFLKNDLEYEVKQKLLGVIKKYCKPRLSLVPVVDSYCQKVKVGFKAVSDFYVGKSTLSLICRRPYESDEGSEIVRMTATNMNLLGITEMDKVIVRYKNKSVRCRVQTLDDEKSFLEANVPISLNYAIGIPAHLRKKLGICNVNTAVKVDRDTGFIFKKSLNEQIAPVLLTLFSINLFNDPSIWKKALVSLLSIPIVVYLNLSSKRNMRG